jgi:TIGR03009 family protein
MRVVPVLPAGLLGRIQRLMSRKLKLVMTGLAVGSLLSILTLELPAQAPAKKNTKPPVRQTQGVRDEVAAPRPKARPLPRNEAPPEAEPEESSEQEEDSRPLPPKAEAFRVEKLSPELEQILKDWEAHSSRIQKLTGSFERHKYDHVYEVDFQSSGKFAYEMPDKGAYEFEGAALPKNAVSRRKNANKQPYALKPDQTERWVCNGKEVLKIDDKAMNYEKVMIPPENQGENIIDGPLPFLFGMKAEHAKRRYSFELLEPASENYKDDIWLRVKPKWARDSVNWREAKIILSRTNYLPLVVKLVDPSDNAETVHIFDDLQVNGKANPWAFWNKKDPFKPDLRKHQLVQNSKEAPPGTAPRQAPDTSSRPLPADTGKAAAKGRATLNDREPPRSADQSNGAPKKKPPAVRK